MNSKVPGKTAKATWRRRLLRMTSRFGLASVDVGPGVSVIMRSSRSASRVLQLRRNLFLVATGDDTKSVYETKLDGMTWLVRTKPFGKKGQANPAIAAFAHADDLKSPKAHLRAEQRIMKGLGSQHIAWTLDRFAVDVVLDVGANVGQYAKSLRAEGFTGHIISFEPVPQFFEKLEEAAAKDETWTVHQMALGQEDGSLPMHVQRSLSSMLASSDFGRGRFKSMRDFDGDEPIEVPVRRLEGILDNLLDPLRIQGIEKPRIYLKMDTQGFDLEAFAGLGDRNCDVVAMQSEVALLLIYEGMPRMREAVATYEAAGFEISGLYPITRQPDGRVIEYDCVLVRAEDRQT